VEDIEWMMARAAGYNAGFALVAAYSNLQSNPQTNQLLYLIKLWQEAYTSEIFSADQVMRLRNPENDFHLEKTGEQWNLYPSRKYKFEHTKQLLQPGQPTFSTWEFENKDAEQPLTFNMTIMGNEGEISNIWLELDGYYKLTLPGSFKAGYSIVCDGEKIKLYNEKGSFSNEISIGQAIPALKTGKHSIKFDCNFQSGENLKIRFIVKSKSNAEVIKMNAPK
jgi:hypothetical protein